MASQANICDRYYESDSDKQQVEDKCPLETLHLSNLMLSDESIAARWTPSVCFWIVPQRPFDLSRVVDTRYTVEDIEGALLKQMKASKDTSIAVKKPEDQNIRFTNYGNSLWIWQRG